MQAGTPGSQLRFPAESCLECMYYVIVCWTLCEIENFFLRRMKTSLSIGFTPRVRHEVAKSLGNQAPGVQPACTMTTQN